mmetsp:Transcript_30197/g.45559  ORF Transcript_30197/g.45559 Transcript_30197/m.45559 type:complete len:246 (+) Transcript_30197:1013-1750(+)
MSLELSGTTFMSGEGMGSSHSSTMGRVDDRGELRRDTNSRVLFPSDERPTSLSSTLFVGTDDDDDGTIVDFFFPFDILVLDCTEELDDAGGFGFFSERERASAICKSSSSFLLEVDDGFDNSTSPVESIPSSQPHSSSVAADRGTVSCANLELPPLSVLRPLVVVVMMVLKSSTNPPSPLPCRSNTFCRTTNAPTMTTNTNTPLMTFPPPSPSSPSIILSKLTLVVASYTSPESHVKLCSDKGKP